MKSKRIPVLTLALTLALALTLFMTGPAAAETAVRIPFPVCPTEIRPHDMARHKAHYRKAQVCCHDQFRPNHMGRPGQMKSQGWTGRGWDNRRR